MFFSRSSFLTALAVGTLTVSLLSLGPHAGAMAQDEMPPADSVESFSQDSADQETVDEDALAAVKRDLAMRLHAIRPAAVQVEDAIKAAAERLPYEERKLFLERVMSYIDMEQLEAVSVDAAIEVFTIEELEVMVDYFRKPEARSIAEKMPLYQGIVRPEITEMLDKALLDLRTGKAGAQGN